MRRRWERRRRGRLWEGNLSRRVSSYLQVLPASKVSGSVGREQWKPRGQQELQLLLQEGLLPMNLLLLIGNDECCHEAPVLSTLRTSYVCTYVPTSGTRSAEAGGPGVEWNWSLQVLARVAANGAF